MLEGWIVPRDVCFRKSENGVERKQFSISVHRGSFQRRSCKDNVNVEHHEKPRMSDAIISEGEEPKCGVLTRY
jgi:hypothetical protein